MPVADRFLSTRLGGDALDRKIDLDEALGKSGQWGLSPHFDPPNGITPAEALRRVERGVDG